MFVLALTGGIGSGKSTAARFFRDRGAVVIDLDDMAKGLIRPGGPMVDAVAAQFGLELKTADGGIDTAALASVAFASPEQARRLDSITHPAVLAATAGALDMLAAQAVPPGAVVLVIPLLVEAPGFFDLVDAVLAISADEDTRLERLEVRGMSGDEARARIACQTSDAERRDIADWVIENDSTMEQFLDALAGFWDLQVANRVT